jgi:hypothetical protein
VLELDGLVVVVLVEVVVVVSGGGPEETRIDTELPGGTNVPEPGLVEIISPAEYAVDV